MERKTVRELSQNKSGITPVLSGLLMTVIAVAGMSIAITATYVITDGLHNNMGEAYRAALRCQEAACSYRRAVEINPDFAQAHNSLGIVLQEQGEVDGAAASYRRAVEIKPAYAEAHSNLGNALIEQGRLEEAISSYQRALEIKPEFADGHFNLGNALREAGDLDAAVSSYRRAIAIEPSAVAKNWNGTIVGCAESGRRSVLTPADSHHVAW